MSFYSTANIIIESLASDEISGKELVMTYVMSLFDFEREATIIYDFLEEEGFFDRGVYMAKTDKVDNDPYGDSHYYIMFPRSVVVGTNVLRRFFKLYDELARDNKFHFLIRQGDSMLIDGKSLVSNTYKVRKWRPMKKKTREHFGDILDGLRESREEKWIYLLKVGVKKDGTEFARYKFLPYSSLSEEDFKIAEQLYDYTNRYSHGRYEGRNDIKVYINKLGHKIDGYRTILFYVGLKDLLEKELHDDKKYQYGTRMKEEIKLKPKTQKHFGKILSGLNEEITTGSIVKSARAHERLKKMSGTPDHVVIFLTYRPRSGKQNEYIFKPIKKLNRQEINIYKTMVKNKIDSGFNVRFNVSVFMGTSDEVDFIPNLDYISMYKGDKKNLEEFLKYYLWVNKREDYVERKPIMGKKAERHFGDIIGNL